jgi:hypothetical protein
MSGLGRSSQRVGKRQFRQSELALLGIAVGTACQGQQATTPPTGDSSPNLTLASCRNPEDAIEPRPFSSTTIIVIRIDK